MSRDYLAGSVHPKQNVQRPPTREQNVIYYSSRILLFFKKSEYKRDRWIARIAFRFERFRFVFRIYDDDTYAPLRMRTNNVMSRMSRVNGTNLSDLIRVFESDIAREKKRKRETSNND